MSQSTATDRRSPSTAWIVLAAVWAVGFCAYFHSFALQNNPEFHRSELWPDLPGYLLDQLVPAAEAVPEFNVGSGWKYFPQRFDLLGCAALILCGSWGLGHLALRGLKLREPLAPLERFVLAAAGGLALLSLITLAAGLAGIFSQPLFVGLLLGSFGFEVAWRWRARSGKSASTVAHRYPYWQAALIGTMCLFGGCMLLGAMLPSNDFDVNEYHLQGPKEWYLAGQITFLPHNVYTSFPFLTEMLSLCGMNVRGDWARGTMVGKTVLMAFAPLTALGLMCLGRRWFSDTVGWLAAGVYLTTPWVYRISIIAYTEGALLCYLVAALLAFDLARRSSTLPTWFLVGFCAGSGMACKYPGLISVVLPLGAAFLGTVFKSRSSETNPATSSRVRWQPFLGAALGLSLAIGPWLLKNLVETGNPVYPLGWTIFGGRDWDAELNQKWRDAHSSKSFTLAELSQSAVEVAARSDYQTPLIFAFAPLAVWFRPRDSKVRWLWVYLLWLFATYWLLTHRLDRFWLPIIPLGALLAAVGMEGAGRAAWHALSGILFVLAALFNFMIVTSGLGGLNTYLADVDALVETTLVQPPGILYLNRELPEGSKVLLVGDANVLDARFPFVYNTVFDKSLFEEWCGARIPESDPPEWTLLPTDEIRANLQMHGITHVFVNWGEILRYRTTYRYTDFVLPHRFDALIDLGLLAPPQTIQAQYLADFSPDQQREIEQRLSERLRTERGDKIFPVLEMYRVLDAQNP